MVEIVEPPPHLLVDAYDTFIQTYRDSLSGQPFEFPFKLNKLGFSYNQLVNTFLPSFVAWNKTKTKVFVAMRATDFTLGGIDFQVQLFPDEPANRTLYPVSGAFTFSENAKPSVSELMNTIYNIFRVNNLSAYLTNLSPRFSSSLSSSSSTMFESKGLSGPPCGTPSLRLFNFPSISIGLRRNLQIFQPHSIDTCRTLVLPYSLVRHVHVFFTKYLF